MSTGRSARSGREGSDDSDARTGDGEVAGGGEEDGGGGGLAESAWSAWSGGCSEECLKRHSPEQLPFTEQTPAPMVAPRNQTPLLFTIINSFNLLILDH